MFDINDIVIRDHQLSLSVFDISDIVIRDHQLSLSVFDISDIVIRDHQLSLSVFDINDIVIRDHQLSLSVFDINDIVIRDHQLSLSVFDISDIVIRDGSSLYIGTWHLASDHGNLSPQVSRLVFKLLHRFVYKCHLRWDLWIKIHVLNEKGGSNRGCYRASFDFTR